jgi:hypothetical protein
MALLTESLSSEDFFLVLRCDVLFKYIRMKSVTAQSLSYIARMGYFFFAYISSLLVYRSPLQRRCVAPHPQLF